MLAGETWSVVWGTPVVRVLTARTSPHILLDSHSTVDSRFSASRAADKDTVISEAGLDAPLSSPGGTWYSWVATGVQFLGCLIPRFSPHGLSVWSDFESCVLFETRKVSTEMVHCQKQAPGRFLIARAQGRFLREGGSLFWWRFVCFYSQVLLLDTGGQRFLNLLVYLAFERLFEPYITLQAHASVTWKISIQWVCRSCKCGHISLYNIKQSPG